MVEKRYRDGERIESASGSMDNRGWKRNDRVMLQICLISTSPEAFQNSESPPCPLIGSIANYD